MGPHPLFAWDQWKINLSLNYGSALPSREQNQNLAVSKVRNKKSVFDPFLHLDIKNISMGATMEKKSILETC